MRISDLQLEQFVLAELPEAQMQAIQAQLRTDTQLQARMEAISASNEALFAAMPVAAFAKRVTNAMQEPEQQVTSEKAPAKSLSWWQWLIKPELAASFVVMLFMGFLGMRFVPAFVGVNEVEPSQEIVRAKGQLPYFKVYRLLGDQGAEQVEGSQGLKENDVLQLSYVASSHQYGALFSIDGNGVITDHLVDGNQAVALSKEGEVQLPQAYMLDDAPKFERFFFVTSDQPFDLFEIKTSAQLLVASGQAQFGDLLVSKPQSQNFMISSISFNKETP